MPGEREVLALRIPLETIIGEDPPQIIIPGEADAVHVEHLALEPTGNGPQPSDARHRRRLVSRDFYADAPILGQRQQMIDDFEPLRPVWIIDPCDLHQLLVFE